MSFRIEGRHPRQDRFRSAAEQHEDEDLMDYIANLTQHQAHCNTSSADEQPGPGRSGPQPTGLHGTSPAPEDDPDSWHPGLGYHPRQGLSSAAEQFAANSLEHALEGNLAQDLAWVSGGVLNDSDDEEDDDEDGSSSDTSAHSAGALNANSIVSSEPLQSIAKAAPAAGSTQRLAPDGTGPPRHSHTPIVWQEDQYQYPVQTRQQLQPPPPTADGGWNGSFYGRGQQRGPLAGSSFREAATDSIADSTLLSALPGFTPEFKLPGIAAVASAGLSAAVQLAKYEVAQYAELLQQLQQGKQNKGTKKGKRGKSVKKQIRKAQVTARRAARNARSHANALQLLSSLEAFACSTLDMVVLPPPGTKHALAFAKQAAGLFHVNAGAQGNSKSGRTCLVLQRTRATSALMEPPELLTLKSYLSKQLAREMSSATIAGDNRLAITLSALQQARQGGGQHQQGGRQRQRSYQQQQQQRSRNYQQPVQFVAGGVLDPNGNPLWPEDEADPHSSTDTQSPSTSGSDTPDEGTAAAGAGGGGGGDGAVASAAAGGGAAGAAAVSPAEVEAFLQEVLLEAAPTAAVPTAAAAAAAAGEPAAGEQQQQQQDQDLTWYVDRQGDASAAAAAGALCATDSAAAQQHEPGVQAAPQQQQQQQQGSGLRQEAAAVAVCAFAPTWFEDRWPGLGQHYSAGASGAAAANTATAVATGVPGAAGRFNAQAPPTYDPPAYERAGLGLGFPAAGRGFLQPTAAPLQFVQQGGSSSGGRGFVKAGGRGFAGSSGSNGGRSGGSSGGGSARLAELEARFRSLQAPGGQQGLGTAEGQGPAAAAAAGWQGNGAGGASAAALDGPSFNMTAQQRKKAKKQQQRNQRREARAAAAATDAPGAGGGGGAPAVQAQGTAVGFASFEVHTTGIGSRLMSRWGWSEGEGLGRERQGRAEPLRATRRPKQLGLGCE